MLLKNKIGESFGAGLFVIFLSIAVISIGFMSSDNNITGYAAFDAGKSNANHNIIELKDIEGVRTLAAGTYYIDNGGIVYWIDDDSKPAVAKINLIYESQKNRIIYVDNEGYIGYR